MSYTPSDFLPDDLDSVLQILEVSDNEWADLAAIHGNFGKWETGRKIVLSECALELRAGPPPKGATAWTDKLLDAASHAHPAYKKYYEDGKAEAQMFNRLSTSRNRVTMKAKSLTYNPVR